jgi:hypothetical protein
MVYAAQGPHWHIWCPRVVAMSERSEHRMGVNELQAFVGSTPLHASLYIIEDASKIG